MALRDALAPVRMERVAVVAPVDTLRRALVAVAESGVVEPEKETGQHAGPAGLAFQRLTRQTPGTGGTEVSAVLQAEAPDLLALEAAGRRRELAGEEELERVAVMAVRHGRVGAIAGWSPASEVEGLARRLRGLGASVVRLPAPRGVDPPTLVRRRGVAGAFQPLVDSYGVVPYADVNPAAVAGVAYVAMFGLMFGDVGHGALLIALGVLVAIGRPAVLVRWRWAAPFIIGAGLASALTGVAFGELFGPTNVVPALWMVPLDHPSTLLAVAVAIGAGLLALSYLLGTVNRWREGGAAHATVSLSGLAGSLLYGGLGLVGLGWYRHAPATAWAGGGVIGSGVALALVGLLARAGGRAGLAQAGVELLDAVVRLGTNTVSFARLAAFGLTHAALGSLVWRGTTALWHRGPGWMLGAAAIFLIGNVVAFTLEALIAGIQALRLEYYELFSRIFVTQGRPFEPWHVPTVVPASQPVPVSKEEPCLTG